MGLFAAIKRSAKECGAPRVLQVGGFPAELFPQPCFQAKTARYAGAGLRPHRSSRPPGCPRTLATTGRTLGPGDGPMGAGQVRFGVAAMQQVRLDRHRGSARRGRHRGCRRHVVFDSVAGGERGLRSSPWGRVKPGDPAGGRQAAAQAAGLSRATCRRSAGSRAGGGRWRGTRHSPLRRRRRRCLFRRRPWSPVR